MMKSKKLLIIGLFLFVTGMGSISRAPSSNDPLFPYPVPRGKYQVGTRFLSLSDQSRPDLYTADTADFRTISLQVWYPSEPAPGSQPLPYYSREIGERVVDMGIFKESFRQDIAAHPSYSWQDAPILCTDGPFPLLLYSSSGVMNANIFLFENLASLGYVVVSVGHPHWCMYYFDNEGNTYFPDYTDDLHYQKMWEEEGSERVEGLKEQITLARGAEEKMALLEEMNLAMPEEIADVNLWVGDLDFVICELEKRNGEAGIFKGMLDLERMAISGYSKGGVVAAHACMTDSRFTAGINLSGFLFGDIHRRPIRVPFMNIESEESWCTDCVPINDLIWHTAQSDVFMVQIKGATHGNFTDLSAYKDYISPDLDGLLGPMDGTRFLEIQAAFICSFLDRYLKDKSTVSLTGLAGKYEEVRFRTNTDPRAF